MSEQYGPILQVLDFPTLAKGMSSEAPSRSLTPGNDSAALFRDVTNLVKDHGTLGSWYGVYLPAELESSGFPTITNNGTWFSTTPNGVHNGQCPVYLFLDFPQTWNQSGSTSQSSFGAFLMVCVTSREIFILSPQNNTWYNATPVYTTGTVEVTGGAPTIVTGTGTNWSTRKIAVGQLIQLESNWYSIKSVDSNTQLTLNSAVTTAPVPAGSNYTIRRCFGGRNYSHGDNLLYGTIFNGDLYIAGRTLAGKDIGPAAIRVSDIYSNVYTTEYLLAGYDLTGSMTAQGSVVTGLWDIKGLQILPDGRVVVATAEVPTSKQGIVGNRLRYSSNTASGSISAQEIWSASPAGFIDVVDHAGEITALGKLGPSTLTIHFHRGISLGNYTAQYDPPLAIQASAAKVGCFAPKTLVLYAGSEIFVGYDGKVHAFNGESTTALTDETLSLIHDDSDNNNSAYILANCHAMVDTRKDYYRLFFCDNNFEWVDTVPAAYADYTNNTVCWLLSLEDGGIYKETYSPHITACAQAYAGTKSAALNTYIPVSLGSNFGTLMIGIQTMNAAGTNDCEDDCLMALGEAPNQNGGEPNAIPYRGWYTSSGGTAYSETPVCSFETDDIDFGLPGVDKTLSHVIAWFSAADGVSGLTEIDTTSLITLEVSTDSGDTWVTIPSVNSSSYPFGLEVPFMFSFTPVAAERFRFRMSRTATAAGVSAKGAELRPIRMRVYYQSQGEFEATKSDLS